VLGLLGVIIGMLGVVPVLRSPTPLRIDAT
jgi:hypothetical protein